MSTIALGSSEVSDRFTNMLAVGIIKGVFIGLGGEVFSLLDRSSSPLPLLHTFFQSLSDVSAVSEPLAFISSSRGPPSFDNLSKGP